MDKQQEARNPAPAAKSGFQLAGLLSAFFNSVAGFILSTQDVIGIDIGSSYLKIVQLRKKSGHYAIRKCITRALPQAARDNPAEKRKLVLEIVKEFVAETRARSGLGRLTLYGKGVFVFSLTVPNLNKKDLRGAVAIELKKRLPFQMEVANVSFDFFVTGQAQEDKQAGLQITCIAAEKALIDESVALLKEVGLRPVAINASPDCMGSLIPFCLEVPAKKTAMLLDMGASTSLLNFYRGKNLVFSREIPIGGEHLTHAMAKTVTLSTGTVTISYEDAEKLKRSCGVPLQDEAKVEYVTDLGPLRGEQITALLRPTLERFVMEINRTVSYFTKTFKAELSDELYLTGGASRLKNLDKFFLFNLEGIQKIEPLNILKKVKGWAETGVLKQEMMMEQAMPHLSAAFAACLGAGGRINLMPVKERVQQKALLLSMALRIGLPLVLVVSVSFYLVDLANARKFARFSSALDRELAQLQETTSLVKEYQFMKTRLEERERTFEQTKQKQPYLFGLLKELSAVIPLHVTLNSLVLESAPGGKAVRLAGKIFAKYSVIDLEISQFQLTLEESPYFSQVSVVKREKDMYSAIPAENFEILCQLKY